MTEMILEYSYIVIETGYDERLVQYGKDFLNDHFLKMGKKNYPQVVSIKEYNNIYIYEDNDWKYIEKHYPNIKNKSGFVIFTNTLCKNINENTILAEDTTFTNDDLEKIISLISPGGDFEYCCIYNLFYEFKIYELNNKKLLYVTFTGTESG